MALTIPPYEGQGWTDDSEPDLSAETLNAVDAGITANSEAINAIANAVVSQIVNDPDKIASMAALYAVNQALTTTNSNLAAKITSTSGTLLNLRVMATSLTFNDGTTSIDLSAYLGGKNLSNIAFAVPQNTGAVAITGVTSSGNALSIRARDTNLNAPHAGSIAVNILFVLY